MLNEELKKKIIEEKKEKYSYKLNKLENKAIKKKNKYDKKINSLNITAQKRKIKYDNNLVKLEKKLTNQKEIDPQKLEKIMKNREKNEPPKLPVLEEIGNAVTHGVGAIIGIVFLILMIVASKTPRQYVSGIIYCLCLIVMMTMSCLYHSFKSGSRVKRLWRRFDYSSIYLLIGGTFAPLYLVLLNTYPFELGNISFNGSTLGLVLFIIQWVVIATGITFVAIFGPGRLRWLHYPLYFILGWSGLLLVPIMIKNCIGLFWFILGGGIIYTLGMIPFVKRGRKAAHFIWHFFVLAGAIAQWIGIFIYIF